MRPSLLALAPAVLLVTLVTHIRRGTSFSPVIVASCLADETTTIDYSAWRVRSCRDPCIESSRLSKDSCRYTLYKLPILLNLPRLSGEHSQSPALPARHEVVKSTGLTKNISQYFHVIPFFTRLHCALSTAAEIALVFASHAPEHPLIQAVLSTLEPTPGGVSHIQNTSEFRAGAAILAGGALLRLACFRKMGMMFTFQLALRNEHKLVTDGPYSFVRHPSYIGVLLSIIGGALVHFGPGSCFREWGWFGEVVGRRYMVLWFLLRIMEITGLTLRTWKEDEMLREQFGDAWEKWARDTPYKLIPFVFF